MLIGLAAVSLSLNTAAADQPVNITCNEDFQAQGFPGSGTPSDPYVIEGLTITGADVAINIENTTVYVVIRNCNLTSNAYALYLYNVSNIRVEDCTFANNDNSTCILLFNSSFTSCTFSGNEYGCCISTSYNVSFSFCSFQDNQKVGCYLDYCFYFNFSDCDFRGSDLCGCLCYDSMLLDFRACFLSGGFWGSGCYDNCSYITIFNSTIYGSSLYFNHSFNITIWYNDFSNAAINMEYSGPFMLNSPYPVIYYYNGDWHRNYIGNDWPGYTGSDPDGDGIGNTPYTIDGYHDCFPLVDNRISYKIPKKSAPINITCNEDFSGYGFPGEGTSTNPYVIDGLTIGETWVAIWIANTDAYVDIRNCNLVYNGYGLFIDNASHIRLINCTIKGNTYEACLCLNSSNIQFLNCDVRDNGGTGFLCADCSNLGFSSCSITGNNCSCFLYKCSNTHFSTSSFSNNLHEGFVAINCTNLAFSTCHFDDNQELGLYCANCSHVCLLYTSPSPRDRG